MKQDMLNSQIHLTSQARTEDEPSLEYKSIILWLAARR